MYKCVLALEESVANDIWEQAQHELFTNICTPVSTLTSLVKTLYTFDMESVVYR